MPVTSDQLRISVLDREARVHEHRDQQAPSAVVDPHHEHPVGRQEGKELHGQEEGQGERSGGISRPEKSGKCHAPHSRPTISPLVGLRNAASAWG